MNTKFLKYFRLLDKLPYRMRVLIYLVYLIIQFMKSLQTLFNPRRGEKLSFPPKTTSIPVETENGIVYRDYSDEELIEKYGQRDAITYDPAFLASKGVEPIVASTPIINPLDAHDLIVESMDSVVPPAKPEPSKPEPSKPDPSNI